jgi:hypothetical protein
MYGALWLYVTARVRPRLAIVDRRPTDSLSFAVTLHYLIVAAANIRLAATSGDFKMAMIVTGEYQLGAPRDVVWAKLNDADVLKSCIPGSEDLEKLSDTEFRATAKMKVGPVSAVLQGQGQPD